MNNVSGAINPSSNDAWYFLDGPENDVVLSTRVRLSRNLEGFPFPSCYKNDDADRILALVFDSFSNINEAEKYQSVGVLNLESLGQRILMERGFINPELISGVSPGVVVRLDGKSCCTVNDVDHLRVVSFVSGLNIDGAYKLSKEIDTSLQDRLQFAASVNMGYLTSNLKDVGTGLKISLLVHLPSISFSGMLERIFKDVMLQGFVISGFYGAGSESGTSLGSYYQIENTSCLDGNDSTQIEKIFNIAKTVCQIERINRKEIIQSKPTLIKDLIFRSVALIKYCRLISSREAIELISKIKWGIDMGMISGITDTELFSLHYRLQDAHLEYTIKTSSFSFEKDIDTNELKIERLRALIIQETLSNIKFSS